MGIQGIATLPSHLPHAEPFTHPAGLGRRGKDHLPPIQAGTLETNQNQTYTPVTPSQRSWVSQQSRHGFPNGSVIKPSSEASNAPFHAEGQSLLSSPPVSPLRVANIRVRRAQNGAALLQSPARAGHATRMRQIFEDAGREHDAAQTNEGISYPRLPNISRKASPLPVNPSGSPDDLLQSPCLSEGPFVPLPNYSIQNPSQQSEQTSGSWSDDSGYFIADSRARASALAPLPRERIYSWLQAIPPFDADDDNETVHRQSQHSSSRDVPDTQVDVSDELIKGSYMFQTWQHLEEPIPSGDCRPLNEDPFLCEALENNLSPFSGSNSATAQSLSTTSRILLRRTNTNEPSRAPDDTDSNKQTIPAMPSTPIALADEPMELSPLSPNVCIERGPSRYHTSRKSINASSLSPSKAQSRVIAPTSRLQENSGRRGRPLGFGSPLGSHRKPLGTRF